jgi:hypothetical protein
MADRQLIADLLSALEYHTEQTRPIEFSKVAIEAAREYLRKPAQPMHPEIKKMYEDYFDKCFRESSPTQQKPVAWLHTKIEGVAVPHRPADLDKHPDRWEALYRTPPPCPTCEALARTVMLDQTSHDTTPPQRTWVELAEDDKVLIKHDANFNQFMTAGEYADRVQALTEARLKDKNT